MSVLRWLTCVVMLAMGASARAQSSVPAQAAAPSVDTPLPLSRAQSADPNAEAFGFEYRGAVRGRFGDVFTLYGETAGKGYAIAAAPFIELHEPQHSHQELPSQYWRARLALVQSYGFVWPSQLLHLSLRISHESDHETAHAYSRPGFLALNDIALRLRYVVRQGRVVWTARADAQVFAVSCTNPARPCRNFRGDSSAGGQLELGASVPSLALWRFAPFASLFASGILAHGLIASEARLSGRLGGSAQFTDSTLALFLLGWAGNDVGVVRHRTLALIGAGVAFTR